MKQLRILFAILLALCDAEITNGPWSSLARRDRIGQGLRQRRVVDQVITVVKYANELAIIF